MVYFSGFSDANKQFSIEFKNQLAKMVTDLGGEVRFDNEFNEHITHVVRPPPSLSLSSPASSSCSALPSVGRDGSLSAYEESASWSPFPYIVYYLFIASIIYFSLFFLRRGAAWFRVCNTSFRLIRRWRATKGHWLRWIRA